MKISTRGRYALKMMQDIAENDKDGPVRIKDIAARQDISVKYLEQIISILSKGGMVKSIRGPQGGYRLAGEPSEYTVGMILRLTEVTLAPVMCVDDDQKCSMSGNCTTIRIWRELDEAISSVIDKYTLEDMMTWESTSPGGNICHKR